MSAEITAFHHCKPVSSENLARPENYWGCYFGCLGGCRLACVPGGPYALALGLGVSMAGADIEFDADFGPADSEDAGF